MNTETIVLAVRLILSLVLIPASIIAIASEEYPHADEPIGSVRQIYDGKLDPQIQINTFRNIDRLFPTRAVPAGDGYLELKHKNMAFSYFSFKADGQTYDLYDYLAIGRVSGLLVLHDGEIAYENYLMGNSDRSRWMSMSVVKSMLAMLVGATIHDGHIQSIDDPLTNYVPRFKETAYDGVTVRQLLQMTSGVSWNETYTDPSSDRRAMLDAQIGQEPGKILDLMAALPRTAAPGSVWNYSTGETQVVSALVREATGIPVADYLSEKIWKPAGMRNDASWWLDSLDGLEIGGSGLSATLRDYARFGLFLLADGISQQGQRVLPVDWVDTASTPKLVNDEIVPYGYMLWPLDDGAYSAIGIFGQFVYVDPNRNIVIAMWSAQPKPEHRSGIDEYIFLAELTKAVQNFYTNPEP
jgi:CubicO group peptidase (beta-lactamase class C family)|tara:strand:- start:463 stop:1698 length:1236 start_codon:yes stop_codon:yes gene_type:complete